VVRVVVASADAELAADVLWRADPSAVSEEATTDGHVLLTADVVGGLSDVDLPAGATVEVVEVDEDHLDAWRAWARPVRAGRRIVLHPAWLQPPSARRGDIVVRLDPGRAFGTGSHPSTRLVAAVLEARVAAGDRVLDVGTGSGVLAVVACLLGAGSAVAIDVDPEAVAAAEANAARNGVAGQVAASTTALCDVPGVFDLVVANIGASVLCDLAPDLRQRLAPRGLVVVSGLLEAQVGEVLGAFTGLVEVHRAVEDGWVAVSLTWPSHAPEG